MKQCRYIMQGVPPVGTGSVGEGIFTICDNIVLMES